MGKVQDTISKIGDRAGLKSNTDIALLVPEQRAPSSDSFPADPDAVGKFIANLAATGSNAVQLIRALQHSNRLVNSPAQRLRVVRLFEPAVHTALTELNAGYEGVDVPYPASAASDFERAATLLQEMAVSYKVILLDVLRKRGKLPRKHRLPVIYQAMTHLAESGLRYSQSFQTWPEKTWRDLNTLYLCAEREQGVDTILSSSEKPNTIRQLYAQCCAFSVCAGAHLRPLQLSRVYRQLGRYSAVVNLSDQIQQTSSDTLYSVALDSAHRPFLFRYSKYHQGQKVRYFDMAPLLDQLNGIEGDDHEESRPITANKALLDQTDYAQLANSAAGNNCRRHARSIRQTLLNAETGLMDIHASLQSDSKTQPDVTETILTQRTYGAQWIVQNRSSGGMGLRWTGKGDCHINVGEIIAHREQDESDASRVNWHIGIIRWIQTDGHESLCCGVETLADYARAVATSSTTVTRSRNRKGNRPRDNARVTNPTARISSAEALLLNEHPAATRPAMLLVSGKVYRLGDYVDVIESTDTGQIHTRSIRILEDYNLGGNFKCFGFSSDP